MAPQKCRGELPNWTTTIDWARLTKRNFRPREVRLGSRVGNPASQLDRMYNVSFWLGLAKRERALGRSCEFGDQCPLGKDHESAVVTWLACATVFGERGAPTLVPACRAWLVHKYRPQDTALIAKASAA